MTIRKEMRDQNDHSKREERSKFGKLREKLTAERVGSSNQGSEFAYYLGFALKFCSQCAAHFFRLDIQLKTK